jgi:threonine/homoserine/homoserine lactone efflux protein
MENIVALMLSTAVLVAIPGPNVALIVAKSVQQGFRAGFVATFGTTTGVAIQLLLVVLGVSAIIASAAAALAVIKWAGVAYLIWLGIRTWKAAAPGLSTPATQPAGVTFSQGLIVALLNPKILLFNAAFLPQFVRADGSIIGQLFVLSGVYLSVLFLGDLLWALLGAMAKPWLIRGGRFAQRLSGSLFIAAGIGLALSRQRLIG